MLILIVYRAVVQQEHRGVLPPVVGMNDLCCLVSMDKY